ncbi:MAG: exopolysaccharide transport family protein [Candidatus Hydrogenedentes bacterium]|nr:exopolysaccharide transport family protein [Candidatus Hydrogenedentota bacterium]
MDQRQLFLRDILTVLFKRKKLIVFFAIVVIAATFAGNVFWPPTYESSARIQILPGRETLQPTTPLTSQNMTPVITMSVEDVNSEIQIMLSDDVLRSVVTDLKLDEVTISSEGAVRGTLKKAQEAYAKLLIALKIRNESSLVEQRVENLRDALAVTTIKDSYTLDVRMRWGTPEMAQTILTTLIAKYKDKHNEVFSTPKEADKVFTEKLGQMQTEWSEAQQALKTFRDSTKVFELDEERKLLLDQYTKAKNLAVQLEQLGTVTEGVNAAGGGDANIMSTLGRETSSTVITELRLRLLELLLNRNETVQSKGPNHPDVIGINNQIKQATSRLKEGIDNATESNKKQIAELEARLTELNGVMDKFDALTKDVEIKEKAYEFMATQVQEMRVNNLLSDAKVNNIAVVSDPSLPTNPIRPRKMLNLVLALIGGIVGGFGIAFFLEYLDHGIKTPEDIEHYVGVSPIGSFFRGGDKLNAAEAQRIASLLDVLVTEKSLQIIEVTSAVRGESAGRVARAIGEAWADDPAGPTLLVDFTSDGGKDGRGLMDLVLGQGRLDDLVSSSGSLYVMGRGGQREIPTYLWRSDQMQRAMGEMRERFMRIIFSMPPVLQSSDSVNLARFSDGVVVVIRGDSTRREVVRRAVEILAEAKGRVLGAVITDRRQIIPSSIYRRI